MRKQLLLIAVLSAIGTTAATAAPCQQGQPCQTQPAQQQKAQPNHSQPGNGHANKATPKSNAGHQVTHQPQAKPHAAKKMVHAKPKGPHHPYQVRANGLNVRANPRPGAPIIGHLKRGEHVQVLKVANGWAEIYFDGHYQWVSANFIVKLP